MYNTNAVARQEANYRGHHVLLTIFQVLNISIYMIYNNKKNSKEYINKRECFHII